MDTVRFGHAVRALRRRKGLTQAALAEKAGVSQSPVSRAERGEVRTLPLRVLERIAQAMDATASVRLYWHGEELDRLLDAAHAGLVEQVVAILRSRGWEIVPEVTFNVYGERGSIDILAYHPGHGALLVVEVKSVVPDMQAMLAGVDRRVRLAPGLARSRSWSVRTVSRLLVLPDDRTARRRVERFAATIDQVLPLRTTAIRHWLADPQSAVGGVLFLPASEATRSRARTRSGPPV
jgi:transcriptional regulator with XRE-family HTH domain